MKYPLAILVLMTLMGCAGTTENMRTWMGVSQSELVEQLGLPHAREVSQFGTTFVWDRYEDEAASCQDQFTVKNNVVISYFSNCGLWAGYFAPVYRGAR